MPNRMEPLSETGIIADLLRQRRRALTTAATQVPTWEYQEWRISDTATTTYTLDYVPWGINHLSLNGLTQRQGTDYTVDFTTGIITMVTTLEFDDVISVSYVTTGERIAQASPQLGGTWVTVLDFNATSWKYKQVVSTDTTNYSSPSYDDSAWTSGQAAFGNSAGPTAVHTAWSTQLTSLWIRHTFTATGPLRVTVRVDNSCDVYVNGTLALSNVSGADNGTLERGPTTISTAGSGSNLIAVRATDLGPSGGGNVTFIDAKVEVQT